MPVVMTITGHCHPVREHSAKNEEMVPNITLLPPTLLSHLRDVPKAIDCIFIKHGSDGHDPNRIRKEKSRDANL